MRRFTASGIQIMCWYAWISPEGHRIIQNDNSYVILFVAIQINSGTHTLHSLFSKSWYFYGTDS